MDGEDKYLEWFQSWRRRVNEPLRPMTIGELDKHCEGEPPELKRQRDESYRDGFEDGFDYALRAVHDLHSRKGFARVNEVLNILYDWSTYVLRLWVANPSSVDLARCDYANSTQPHPLHWQEESWPEIRARIVRRDGKCVRCGDVIQLEVDHITEVQDGGLPQDENLRTLCKSCHKGKRYWDK